MEVLERIRMTQMLARQDSTHGWVAFGEALHPCGGRLGLLEPMLDMFKPGCFWTICCIAVLADLYGLRFLPNLVWILPSGFINLKPDASSVFASKKSNYFSRLWPFYRSGLIIWVEFLFLNLLVTTILWCLVCKVNTESADCLSWFPLYDLLMLKESWKLATNKAYHMILVNKLNSYCDTSHYCSNLF